MKKILLIIMIFAAVTGMPSFAENLPVLKAGVSLEKRVPATLMGTWRVAAALKNTDSPQNFKQTSVDIWNLSRTDDVINLSNTFSGASATVEAPRLRSIT